MRQTVIEAVLKHKLIAILRAIEPDKLIPLAQALYDGGIRLLEITYSADGKVPDEVTAANIRRLASHFEGRMFIGAGTVLTAKQVQLTKEAGGLFIISPNTDEDVIAETVRLGLVSLPGAFTPTEIAAAHKMGADFVKVFPAGLMGPEYIKAVAAPLSQVRMLAVGGIELGSMADYLKAGAYGFGISSSLTDKAKIAACDWAGITALAKQYTEVLQNG